MCRWASSAPPPRPPPPACLPARSPARPLGVVRTRYVAIVIGGALMAVGGAFLSLAQLGAVSPGIVAGRGWVCIALVIFAQWDPIRGMLGALLFGGVFALQLRLQTMGFGLPYEILLALPYLVTILGDTLSPYMLQSSASASARAPARR